MSGVGHCGWCVGNVKVDYCTFVSTGVENMDEERSCGEMCQCGVVCGRGALGKRAHEGQVVWKKGENICYKTWTSVGDRLVRHGHGTKMLTDLCMTEEATHSAPTRKPDTVVGLARAKSVDQLDPGGASLVLPGLLMSLIVLSSGSSLFLDSKSNPGHCYSSDLTLGDSPHLAFEGEGEEGGKEEEVSVCPCDPLSPPPGFGQFRGLLDEEGFFASERPCL